MPEPLARARDELRGVESPCKLAGAGGPARSPLFSRRAGRELSRSILVFFQGSSLSWVLAKATGQTALPNGESKWY
jgi:hypothetical protein